MKTALKKDEIIILETKPHWFTLVVPALSTIVVSIIGFFIGSYGMLLALAAACYFIYKTVERNNNIWAVTSLRVVDEFGVLSNNAKESPLDKINNVTYRQTFVGQIFGFGDIQIQTAAEIGSTTYSMVEKPKELKDTITRMQEEYKEQQIKKQAIELAQAMAASQQNFVSILAASQQSNIPETPATEPETAPSIATAPTRDIAAELEKLFDLRQRGIITGEEYTTLKTKILNS